MVHVIIDASVNFHNEFVYQMVNDGASLPLRLKSA